MHAGREEDRKILTQMSKDELVELLFIQMRNLWAVDGLYYLGIEEMYGTEGATEIDCKVWLGIKESDIPTLMEALRMTSWSLDLEDKEIEVEKDKGIFKNINCRVQKTRIKKGLKEFPCKNVRWGYLKSFAKEFNRNVVVECKVCPPDKHTENLWCEWEFRIKQ